MLVLKTREEIIQPSTKIQFNFKAATVRKLRHYRIEVGASQDMEEAGYLNTLRQWEGKVYESLHF